MNLVKKEVNMSYIEKNVLSNNENVVEKVQLHPLRIVLAWIWGILGFWLLFIPTIKAIKLTVSYKTTEMVITNKKAIEKYGWIKVHCDEMGLDKIENVTVDFSFWGRIFGYGNVHIQGTNRNNVNFIGVKNPEQVRKIINDIRG